MQKIEYYELSTYKTELDLILDYSLAYLQAHNGFCTASNHKTCMVRAKKDAKYYSYSLAYLQAHNGFCTASNHKTCMVRAKKDAKYYSQAQLVYIALQALVLFPGPKPAFFKQ